MKLTPLSLILVSANILAQPVSPAIPQVPAANWPDYLPGIPSCAGPSMVRNIPQYFEGTDSDGNKWSIAWCSLTNGDFSGWVRMRTKENATNTNAPVVWFTDGAPRPVVAPPSVPLFIVSPGILANKARGSYNTVASTTGYVLGSPSSIIAQNGVACACDMLSIVKNNVTYCPFAPNPVISNVTVCKPVTTPAEATKAAPSAAALQMLRDPMMMPAGK